MIDYWSLARDFSVGDTVQKFMPGRSGDVSPYYGRVLAVLPKIGFLDVQWPFGSNRESPEDLVKVNPAVQLYIPPQLNFSYYPGLDARKGSSKIPNVWRTVEVPPTFHRVLSSLWHKGADEVQAYDSLWHRFASHTDDAAMKDEVSKFYRFGSGFGSLFWNRVARVATYWSSPGRQHRATRPEIDIRQPNCPRCKTPMKKTIYKMDEGKRTRLFACPSCLYLIRQADIYSPEGRPVEW